MSPGIRRSSFFARLRAHRRLEKSVHLWYHPSYAPPGLSMTARVPNVDIDRSAKVLAALEGAGLLAKESVRTPAQVTLRDLALAHDRGYLERSLSPATLGQIFALELGEWDVDPIVTSMRRAVGGTVEAARFATMAKGRIGFNVGGGFHHAQRDSGAGFCVYNDLAVAIAKLRELGFVEPIAVIDLDFHQGDGTLATFSADPSVRVFSIHGSVWSHVDTPAHPQVLLPKGTGDAAYLAALEASLPGVLAGVGLVLYVAGNDVLAGDALGDFALTPAGVLTRDRMVIEAARARELSVVVTMGGGYSRGAWRCTASFVRWLLTDEADPWIEEEDVRHRFERIARALDPLELQREEDLQLTEAEIFGELYGRRASHRILDFYSIHGVELALERYGLLDAIHRRGFQDLDIAIDPKDPERQRLTVRGRRGPFGPKHHLVDLIVRRQRISRSPAEGGPLELVSVEWLQLQDPTRGFTLEQPRLPGQEHPGLGLAREVMELLFQAALRLELDGLGHHPSRFHIAYVARERFQFLAPRIQGKFEAIMELLEHEDLVDVAYALDEGRLVAEDGEKIAWDADQLVAPASERLKAELGSEGYDVERRASRDYWRRRALRIVRS